MKLIEPTAHGALPIDVVVREARESGATITITVSIQPDADDRLTRSEAARIAGTSIGVVSAAIRRGELAAFGGERDRIVRRGDLEAWVESRRYRPSLGPVDGDIERRIRKLERGKAAA